MTDISSQQKKPGNISQSNAITEAAYYLPLQAKRVLWLCLQQCYKMKGNVEDISPAFTIQIADYQKVFNVSQNTASLDVKRGVEQLSQSSVTFYPTDGDYEVITRPWLIEAGLRRGRGKWEVEFNPRNMPNLIGLSQKFTTFNLYDVGKLNSVNAIRLYESFCQWQSSGIWITSQQWMSERFRLPESQKKSPAEFKRTFLLPSLKKINARSPITAEYTETEDGRLIFTILKKEGN